MPPGYYGIVQFARMLAGDPHVALRLPSIFGYILTLLAVYCFTRRKRPALVGLVAVLLISLSPFRAYAIEARAYALLVGFLAIAAVFWQRLDKGWFMTPLFAVSLILAVACHHLAVVAIAIFGVAELSWTFLNRRIRWGVWVGCLLAFGPFVLDYPLLQRYREIFGKHFWAKPDWDAIVSTYGDYTGLDTKLTFALIIFLGIFFFASLRSKLGQLQSETPGHDFELPEIVLVGGFLLYPAVLLALTKVMHSGYTDRYGWPAIFGLVLGAVYLLPSAKPASTYLLLALLVPFLYQARGDVNGLRRSGSMKVDEHWVRLETLCHDELDLPVVIANGMTYLEAVYYSPPGFRDRLVEMADADLSVKLAGADTVDKTNLFLAQFVPLHVEAPASFESAHERFFLYANGGLFDWFSRYLVEKKAHMKLLWIDGGNALYLVEP
jgi:hypothetical protein